ncbi:MAG: GNAT family N-acetyltransferase [Chitinophagaceae bacterium]
MEKDGIHIRTIERKDNIILAQIIRTVLSEYGINKAGTVASDPATDNLFNLYQKPKSTYLVVEFENDLIGGAGIHRLDGNEAGICELQKMYLLPVGRGKGIGSLLINKCLQFAKEQGYKQCYLESMPELKMAIHLYEKKGFHYLDGALGNTGHYACGVWMLKDL